MGIYICLFPHTIGSRPAEIKPIAPMDINKKGV